MKRLVRQTKSHAIYSILSGLLVLTVTIAVHILFMSDAIVVSTTSQSVISFIVYFGLGHYVITMYLLPARMYAIIGSRDS